MSGFRNAIANALGQLIIKALSSPNFVHNTSGWSINQDGSAEFNNLQIRGTFNGTDFIINSIGAFFYDGVPAAGNLIASITSAGGTDSFGNPYDQGFGSYGDATSAGLIANMVTGQLKLTWLANALGIGGPGATVAAGLNIEVPGNNSTNPGLVIQGPSADPSNAGVVPFILMQGFSQDGTAKPSILMQNSDGSMLPVSIQELLFPAQSATPPAISATPILYADANGSLERLAPSGRHAVLVDSSSSSAQSTVTSATFANLTANWGIPASDAFLGTTYRLTAWGLGTWGSTQQQLNIRGNLTGATGLGAVHVASTFMGASQTFNWKMTVDIVITATGVSGTWIAGSTLSINETQNPNTPGTNTTNAMGVASQGNGSVNTATAFNIWLEAQWASTTGAPSITCVGSILERLGS